ncbi:replication-associated recombination protein A, partial [Candidatus Parcubacteria bacterium]|nr:replication-associated recombination protein A [Candidatus Parcubacteria bacterium]
VEILKKALSDKDNGLGKLKIEISKKDLNFLAEMSGGDARTALNTLEFASNINRKIDKKIIKEAFQKSLAYDKNGEEHYNIISALHKSMRGSDADAALYWLARMLEGGENPLYVARRLIRFASEDIGIANSLALDQAVAAYQACHFIGYPECSVNLAQAVVYMAKSKKSNELYQAYGKAVTDVKKYGNLPVPLHIRNAPTKLMKDLNYSKGYKYSPDFDYKEEQEYLPKKLKGRKYLNFKEK